MAEEGSILPLPIHACVPCYAVMKYLCDDFSMARAKVPLS